MNKNISYYTPRNYLLIAFIVTVLTACGGGGGGTHTSVFAPFGTKQMGVAGVNTMGGYTATSANLSVYIAGITYGGLDGNTLAGTSDYFLTKYDLSGNKIYTKQMGVSGAGTSANTVATDSTGNVYVAGSTNGGLDGNTLTGLSDFFLARFDSSGNKIYTKQLGASGGTTSANSTSTDLSNNVYVSGVTNQGLDGNTETGSSDIFLTKYNSSGSKLYTKQWGVAALQSSGQSTATDATGNVYVAGWTTGGLDGNTQTGTIDFFLTKFDSTGTKIYTKQMGVAGQSTVASSVTTDVYENVYVTGWTSGGLDGNTVSGVYDLFITKYDSTGTKIYTKQMGVVGASTQAMSIVSDASGNIYVTGTTTGGLDGNTKMGNYNYFLTKYNSSGIKLYTKEMGVLNQSTYANSISTDTNGNIYVGGDTSGGLDGSVQTGTYDFFLTRFSSTGVKN